METTPVVVLSVTPCASGVKPVTRGSALGAAAGGACAGGAVVSAQEVAKRSPSSASRRAFVIRILVGAWVQWDARAPTCSTTALPGGAVRSAVPSPPTTIVRAEQPVAVGAPA